MSESTTEGKLYWFQCKINSLTEDVERKNNLLEVKSVLISLDSSALQCIVRSVQLDIVFDCLNSSDTEQIELATSILSIFLSGLTNVEVLNMYSLSIQRALTHPFPSVKRTFLRKLENCLDAETIVLLATLHSGLILIAADCIGDAELSVAQGAVDFLKKLGRYISGLQVLYSEQMLILFKKIMSSGDIPRFRIYEVAVDVSLSSVEGLHMTHMSGILDSLMLELKSNDCLLQLNVLELLTLLVSKQHCLDYLQQQGVIEYLTKKIVSVYDEPMPFVMLPGLIQFFGALIKVNPLQISDRYPAIINTLFESLDTQDNVILGVLISTVGYIGSTKQGKMLLYSQSAKMKVFLSKIVELINVQSDIRVTALKTLSNLIYVEISDNIQEIANMTEIWFQSLGSDIIDKLMQIAKLPFIEERLGALELLSSVAQNTWGIEKLALYPGLIEYLLDRSTESEKNCKHTKFSIVQHLVKNEKTIHLVDSQVYLKMKEFVNEGPYYVATEPEMAIEGSM